MDIDSNTKISDKNVIYNGNVNGKTLIDETQRPLVERASKTFLETDTEQSLK